MRSCPFLNGCTPAFRFRSCTGTASNLPVQPEIERRAAGSIRTTVPVARIRRRRPRLQRFAVVAGGLHWHPPAARAWRCRIRPTGHDADPAFRPDALGRDRAAPEKAPQGPACLQDPHGRPNGDDPGECRVPAQAASEVVKKAEGALSFPEAGHHLNAPRVHAELLAREGFIKPHPRPQRQDLPALRARREGPSRTRHTGGEFLCRPVT
jgi:hypothetical protein